MNPITGEMLLGDKAYNLSLRGERGDVVRNALDDEGKTERYHDPSALFCNLNSMLKGALYNPRREKRVFAAIP
jgi:hypothetical protein